jgi:hypothetical protein
VTWRSHPRRNLPEASSTDTSLNARRQATSQSNDKVQVFDLSLVLRGDGESLPRLARWHARRARRVRDAAPFLVAPAGHTTSDK